MKRDRPKRPSRTDRPVRTERPDRPFRPGQDTRSERPERPDRPFNPESRADPYGSRPGRPNREDRPHREHRRDRRETESDDPSAPRPVAGRNAVEEALRAGSRIRQLYVADAVSGADIKGIIHEARQRNIKVTFTDRDALSRLAGGDRHQGIVGILDPFDYADPEQMVQRIKKEKGLIVVLDSVQDPHNLGAIIRSAEAFGAGGLLIPKDRQAPVTTTVERAAAGATAHLPVARIGNLARALEHLKEEGYWVVGADANNGIDPDQLDLDRPLAILMGSEEKGIRPVNLRQCDATVKIPLTGKVGSLNVSVAAGVMLYALTRPKKAPKAD